MTEPIEPDAGGTPEPTVAQALEEIADLRAKLRASQERGDPWGEIRELREKVATLTAQLPAPKPDAPKVAPDAPEPDAPAPTPDAAVPFLADMPDV